MVKRCNSFRSDLKISRSIWGELPPLAIKVLRQLNRTFNMSVAEGDLLLLEGRWYITHSGLLHLANRKRCSAIRTELVREFCDAAAARWVFKATVYKSARSKGFVGYGDADPSNVSSLVHGAEMRMAETRAVNRALRKAYGIGLCSIEEIGSSRTPTPPYKNIQNNASPSNGNGQPRLRDRLCQLIRQYNLDSGLVKQYAVAFCGTQNLREASRQRLEDFVKTLAEEAGSDRAGLVCKLNSYTPVQEAQS
jgi:hypothetical protein